MGHDLPELAGEVAEAGHLDEAVCVPCAVVDDVEGVARESIGEAVPGSRVEGAGVLRWRDCNGFDGDVELHGGGGGGNVADGDEGVGAGVGFAVRVRDRGQGGIVRSTGEGVACVAGAEEGRGDDLQVVEAVGLQEADLGVELIRIA